MVQVLRETIPVLSQEPDPTWLPWIRSRFLHTLAAAWQAAAQQVCLDFNVDSDALVDVIDEGGHHARIVLSDTVPGGGGLVETLTRRLADDPRRFDALVAAAVEPSDSEEVDPSLRRVLELLATSARVSEAAQRFRAGVADRLEAWQSLIACLADEGVPQTHANISALSARVFRPGSGTDSDDLLRWPWTGGTTSMAVLGSRRPSRRVCVPRPGRSSARHTQAASLLRPRGEMRRPGATGSAQPAVDTSLRPSPRNTAGDQPFRRSPALDGEDPADRCTARRPPAVDVDIEDWRG